jgi:regulator of protease activity HflC (stomatin/prohibitin superfamily)
METQSNNSPKPRGSRLSIAVLVALFLIVGVVVAGVRNVPGGMVGVKVNNFTGDVELADRVGLHFTIPYAVSFYTIDRTTKQLDMTVASVAADGTRPIDDFLNVKAKDGDNVKIDIKAQYNIIPEKAVAVLRGTGSAVLELMKTPPARSGDDAQRWNRFERRWIWPTVRTALSDRFNELTREEMNEGAKRSEAANLAREDVNKLLRDRFGIEVTTITVENPTSYQQYELIVRQRKDTDQEVSAIIQEQAQEKANQEKQIEEETRRATVALQKAVATNLRNITEANAKKEETIRKAESERSLGQAKADAALADQNAIAKTKRSLGESEALGIKSLGEALSGARGITLVAAEFAKRIKDMSIQASPFLYNAVVQPYLMQQGANVITPPLAFPQQNTQQPAGGNK